MWKKAFKKFEVIWTASGLVMKRNKILSCQRIWKAEYWSIPVIFSNFMTWKVYFIVQAWSITYHSWLTFVLLFWACLTWITPFARWFCMVSSPYLVVYADMLLIIQYIYGMELTNEELPESVGKFNFSELGLSRKKYPVLHLGAQVDIPKILVLWFLFLWNSFVNSLDGTEKILSKHFQAKASPTS